MPYQYGMQNSPAGGNGLGGLPKKQTTPTQVSFTRIVTAGSGVIVPPANAKYMRVAVVGGGGAAGNYGSGGGGGCAASKIAPVSPIAYSIGQVAVPSNAGQNTTASFPGYFLIGGGGNGVLGVQSAGGVGQGGDYNFTGGNGSALALDDVAGGGAAGPNGNGTNAGTITNGFNSLIFDGSGWGPGGGGSGTTDGNGGSGTSVLPRIGTSTIGVTGPWGRQGVSATKAGGEMGGGGGKNATSAIFGNGGIGGVVVEWFYD